MQKIPVNVMPEQAYWALKDFKQPFWLDSGMDANRLGRYSFLGADPTAYFCIKDGGCGVYQDLTLMAGVVYDTGEDGEVISHVGEVVSQTPWELLRQVLADRRLTIPSTTDDNQPGFWGGAVGYFSYDLKDTLEILPHLAQNDLPIPLCQLHFYDWVYAYDHLLNQGFLLSYSDQVDLSPWRVLLESPQTICLEPGPFVMGPLKSNMTRDAYNDGLDQIKSNIASGDIYQMNFTQRFSAPFQGDVISLYYRLRRENPAPFASFLRYPDLDILSCSPERFIEIRGNVVETRPIKGTVARGKDPLEDEANRLWLQQSEKDRSELLMIVDLERNDLSKIAAVGSVRVPELFAIEQYPTVFHLVSTVQADLGPNKDIVDVIQATFPGGSITGTPKIRAMCVIDQLEPTCRNLYTGSIGYISDSGHMDLNIVIRTIVKQKDIVHYQVGGGIVWDSKTDDEFEESLTKGGALKRVLYHDHQFE